MGFSVFAGAGQWRAAADDSRANGLFGLDASTGSWTSLRSGLPDGVEVRALVIDPRNHGTVWAGTQHGPYRSGDGGETWEARPLPDGTAAEHRVVWSICPDPSDADTLYVGTQANTVFRSRDAGRSWQQLAIDLPPGVVHMSFPMRVVRIAVDPGNSDHLQVAFEVGGTVHSTDGGATWKSGNPSLLALSQQQHLKSRIISDTETEGMMDSHAVVIGGSKTVWLANRMGLFNSADNGATWQELGIGRYSPLTYARDVAVSAHVPGRLYAALSGAANSDAGSLWRSEDDGESWHRFDHTVAITSTLMSIAESRSRGERVYCAARRGQVLGTEDGGTTWTGFPLPDGIEGVYALAVA